MNNRNAPGSRLRGRARFEHHPRMIRDKSAKKSDKKASREDAKAAEGRDRGRAAELSPRAGADQARRLAGGRLRRGRARAAGGSGGGRRRRPRSRSEFPRASTIPSG